MPQPKFDKYDQVIAELAAEYPKASEVWRRFRDLAAEQGWHDAPAERTVKRRVAEFQGLPQKEQLLNRLFRWPTSMTDGVVPWEASSVALDLLRVRDQLGVSRPVNREVLWYWWLFLARPDLNEQDRALLSSSLARSEFAQAVTAPFVGPDINDPYEESFEWYLAYAPWRNRKNRAAYQRAAARDESPIPLPDTEFASYLPVKRGSEAQMSYPFERWAHGAEARVKAQFANGDLNDLSTHGGK